MLLTLSTTHRPATDLGYLLRKNPERTQVFPLSFGQAHVFYPEATEERCTAALLLEIDPVRLVRRTGPAGENRSLEQYVNDRPYVASSFLSVAMAEVFGSALSGSESKDRPGLAGAALPFAVNLAAVHCHGGETFLRRLFEPLGYTVTVEAEALDPAFPEWGASPYYRVELSGVVILSELLSHLYVLIPVLDQEKHYWVGDDEVEKLLRHGEGWLADHPEKKLIAHRYLKHRRDLVDDALGRLMESSASIAEASQVNDSGEEEAVLETPINLNEQRHGAVIAALKSLGARRVLDLGCGEGRLFRTLVKDPEFEEVVGMDVSHQALQRAEERLERLPEAVRRKGRLLHGSLMYRDERLAGFPAAVVVEVIEHLDPPRLAAFERVLFEFAHPGSIVITTPNAEYNVKWESLPAGGFRHRDHRFEWSRDQFHAWAERLGKTHGYAVRYASIGLEDSALGPPTQMAIFTRKAAAPPAAPT